MLVLMENSDEWRSVMEEMLSHSVPRLDGILIHGRTVRSSGDAESACRRYRELPGLGARPRWLVLQP